MPRVKIPNVGVVTVKEEDLPKLRDYLQPDKKAMVDQALILSNVMDGIKSQIQSLVEQSQSQINDDKSDRKANLRAIGKVADSIKSIKIDIPEVKIPAPNVEVKPQVTPNVDVTIPKASKVRVGNIRREDDRIESCDIEVTEWVEYN